VACNWMSASVIGGEGTRVLYCFVLFFARVFCANAEALSSNIRFFRASLVKGLFLICTFHMFY
jgi:hypothetical protein